MDTKLTQLWPEIVRTALLGTERTMLPDAVKACLLPSTEQEEDTAFLVLEALAAAHLMRKAVGNVKKDEQATRPNFAPDEPDLLPCSTATAQQFQLIIAGIYLPALPEFMGLMDTYKRRVPPEFLPKILDRCIRDKVLFQKIRPVLGQRAQWLAAQNTEWATLFATPDVDWSTASFAERVVLLHKTRNHDPLDARMLIESTWKQDRPEHKLQFIRLLRAGLSPHDEDLLEMALLEKNKELRLVALQLLCCTDSRKKSELTSFFHQNIVPCLQNGFSRRVLEEKLTDISDDIAGQLVSVLPAKSVGQDWRLHISGLLFSLLPPSQLALSIGKAPEDLLENFCADTMPDAFISGLLAGVALHADEKWACSVLHFFEKRPEHPVWGSDVLREILNNLPEQTYQREAAKLLQNGVFFDLADGVLAKSLLAYTGTWGHGLLEAFIQQFARMVQHNRYIKPRHLQNLLESIPYQCLVSDAVAMRNAFLPPPDSHHPWRREIEQFYETIRFREEMKRGLAGA